MGSIPAANLAEVSPGVLSARLKLRPRLSRVMGFIAVANLAEVSPGVPRYLTSPLAVEKDRENGKGQNGQWGPELGISFRGRDGKVQGI
jgi:hypothetical protein